MIREIFRINDKGVVLTKSYPARMNSKMIGDKEKMQLNDVQWNVVRTTYFQHGCVIKVY